MILFGVYVDVTEVSIFNQGKLNDCKSFEIENVHNLANVWSKNAFRRQDITYYHDIFKIYNRFYMRPGAKLAYSFDTAPIWYC